MVLYEQKTIFAYISASEFSVFAVVSNKVLRYYLSVFSSPQVKVTNRYQNPIASMNVDWTVEMVNDLKKYESKAETFIPRCLSKNITSIKVSASCKPASPEDSYIIGTVIMLIAKF